MRMLIVALLLSGCASAIEIVEPHWNPERTIGSQDLPNWPIDPMSKAEPVDFSKPYDPGPIDRMPTSYTEWSEQHQSQIAITGQSPTFIPRTVPKLIVGQKCNGSNVVSIKYIGQPGTRFTHEGRSAVIPAIGWVELISNARGLHPVETDAFGMITVTLP